MVDRLLVEVESLFEVVERFLAAVDRFCAAERFCAAVERFFDAARFCAAARFFDAVERFCAAARFFDAAERFCAAARLFDAVDRFWAEADNERRRWAVRRRWLAKSRRFFAICAGVSQRLGMAVEVVVNTTRHKLSVDDVRSDSRLAAREVV